MDFDNQSIADDISHAYQDGFNDGYEKGKADAEFYLLHCGDTDEPPTNADRIRSMSDEELVDFMYNENLFPWCAVNKECKPRCRDCFAEWLKEEVSE